jgi:hypothetical protein
MAMRLIDCEEELAAVRERLKDLEAQLFALGTERNELQAVAQGWEAIVTQKRKLAGQSPLAIAHVESPQDHTGLQEHEEGFGLNSELEEEGINKTQFVRDEILRNGSKGTSAAELKKAAISAGLEHPPSWPYGPLQRLKKAGEIVKRKGRFYPVAAERSAAQ